ncbi:PREDICTED: G-box-binding factor 4 [Brassica oleracea var. oleracea]|uniref:BZIP domain-containing protein n=1 Tax=Brassica oleracea var. oleracea TaxID=109376 RepID=A0A0D3D8T7_BRAOL|nr:PREDICTED: G-box-binding factor 4 [Brassica oleracea var. oleracea]
MASFKVMHSSTSTNSDPSRRIPSSSIRPQPFRRDPNARILGGYDGYSPGTMTVEGILHETFASDPPATDSSLLMDAAPTPMEVATVSGGTDTRGKSVDEVWREIVSGEGKGMKEEAETQHDEMMTLEDFLAKATGEDGGGGGESDDVDAKIPPESYGFDHHNPFQMIDKVEGSIVAFGNGVDVYGGGGGGGGGARGKRARVMMEPLDKAAAQRQRRMIKNRESAARSRERKQAYQVELETLAAKLEEENEKLSVEIEEKRKERYQKLLEFLIPVVEKPKQEPRFLRRIRSLEW